MAEACAALGLKFAVITSVNRDDRKDGGAELFALTIRAIRDVSQAAESKCWCRISRVSPRWKS